MARIDRCRREDIPSIAKLHLMVYGNPNGEPHEDLEAYYERILFGNPWLDEEIPSLVYRSEEGRIEGLLGVLVRRMIHNGQPIRAAIPHSLMVAPECGAPMAAIQMVREFFDGAQDLVFGDGANDLSRKLLGALGATTSYLYSMHWLCILRPCAYLRSAMGTRSQTLKSVAVITKPLSFVADSLAFRFRRKSIRLRLSEGCSCLKMDVRTLLSCVKDFTKRIPLHPDYNENDIQYLEDRLRSKSPGSATTGYEVRNGKGDRIGIFLCTLGAKKSMEVVLLLAREDSNHVVFNSVLNHALSLGAKSVEGKLAPRFLQSISDNNCLLKRRSWTLFGSKEAEILNAINRGDAQLSALDGEFVVTAR